MVPDPIVDPWSVMFRGGDDEKWECWETYEGYQEAHKVFEEVSLRLRGIIHFHMVRGWGATQPDWIHER